MTGSSYLYLHAPPPLLDLMGAEAALVWGAGRSGGGRSRGMTIHEVHQGNLECRNAAALPECPLIVIAIACRSWALSWAARLASRWASHAAPRSAGLVGDVSAREAPVAALEVQRAHTISAVS